MFGQREGEARDVVYRAEYIHTGPKEALPFLDMRLKKTSWCLSNVRVMIYSRILRVSFQVYG